MSAIEPEYRPTAERFIEHMKQFEALRTPPEASKQPPNVKLTPPKAYASVKNVKDTIAKPFRSLWERRWLALLGTWNVLGGAIVVVSVGIGAVTAAALGIGLGAGLPVIALGAVILGFFFYFVRKRGLDEKALKDAKNHGDIVPLFERLSPEAQARFFVELGPEFRAKLCEWNEKKYHDNGMTQLSDLVDTLQDDKIPKEWGTTAFQSLPLRTLKAESRYGFQSELRSLLIEKGTTGGTIFPKK
jgi:hypothetical protein